MPQLSDRNEIRRILETDREWSAYALADLDPGFFEHCNWYCPERQVAAVALVYRAYSTPVMVTVGSAEYLAEVLPEIETALGSAPSMYLSVRPDVLRMLSETYDISDVRPMLRMRWNSSRNLERLHGIKELVRLGPSDLSAVQQLFLDGKLAGEVPAFFVPSMLGHGVYWGMREGDSYVAVAGTHLLSQAESVGAIGNVYTRRDRRGRGFGSMVTNAVVADLQALKLRTIILNVHIENHAARKVYERLGFEIHCEYFEAVASRKK